MINNINEIGFASTTQSLLLSFIEGASRILSDTYTNSLQEVFSLTPTDQNLAQLEPITISLQTMLISVARDMKKLYPIK